VSAIPSRPIVFEFHASNLYGFVIVIQRSSSGGSAAFRSASATSGSKRREKTLTRQARQILSCEVSFIASDLFRDPEMVRRLQVVADQVAAESKRPSNSKYSAQNRTLAVCSIGMTPLLKPEQERELFLCFNYLKWRANALRSTVDPQAPAKSQLVEVEKLLRRAELVRDRILSANLRLVMSIAKRLADPRHSFDDLFSEGVPTLIRAVEKFDIERGFRFSTYAYTAIRRSLSTYLARLGQHERRWKTAVDPAVLERVEQAPADPTPFPEWARIEVRKLLGGLPPRESDIVKTRFGLAADGSPCTLQEIGKKNGVSKERARQLLARAVARLQGMLRSSDLLGRLYGRDDQSAAEDVKARPPRVDDEVDSL
jgi:RNA polymerase primary sigma factor